MKIVAPIAAACCLSACATELPYAPPPPDVMAILDERMSQAAAHHARGEWLGSYIAFLDAAETTVDLTTSINERVKGKERHEVMEIIAPMSDNRLFAHAAWAHSGMGINDLMSGSPDNARQQFETALEVLRLGEDTQRSMQAYRDDIAEENNQFVQSIVLGAASVLGAYAVSEGVPMDSAMSMVTAVNDAAAEWVPAQVDTVSALPAVVGPTRPGDDGIRVNILPVMGPFRAVGRLLTPDGSCTASLLEPQIVLTNAHCVTDDDGLLDVAPEQARFTLTDPFSSISIPVRRIVTHRPGGSDWHYAQKGAPGRDAQWRHDWALLELAYHPRLPTLSIFTYHYFDGEGRRLDHYPTLADILGPGYLHAPPPPGGRLAISGHSGDLNDGRFQSLTWDCPAVDVAGRPGQVTYHCRGWRGSSGSPVFGIVPAADGGGSGGDVARLTLVGVNAYGGYGDEPYNRGGPSVREFAPAVEALRREIGTPRIVDPPPGDIVLFDAPA